MRLVTVKVAAEHTGISQWSLKRGAKAGLYPHTRVGNRYMFNPEILDEYIRKDMEERLCNKALQKLSIG